MRALELFIHAHPVGLIPLYYIYNVGVKILPFRKGKCMPEAQETRSRTQSHWLGSANYPSFRIYCIRIR